MDSKEVFKAKIANRLSKWKKAIDELKTKLEQAEVDTMAKLHDQLDSLHDKRVKAEKILEDISATSQDAWEQVKSGAEQGWTEVTRTARNSFAKVRQAMATSNQEEEIRQIAYRLWQEEGCPDGRHVEHWLKAKAIWSAQQQVKARRKPARQKSSRTEKQTAAPARAKGRAVKSRRRRDNESATDDKET